MSASVPTDWCAGERLLFDNPFNLLGVSVRDNVSRIMEAASDPLLAVSPERAQQARLLLTNPRARLGAEIGWLPGVAPGRTSQLLEALRTDYSLELTEIGLPVAARANLLTSGLPAGARANLLVSGLSGSPPGSVEVAVGALSDALDAIHSIDPADLLRDINEDRALAGIPPVRSTELVVQALEAHLRLYLLSFQGYLNRLPSDMLVEVMTRLVNEAAAGGQGAPGEMLDLLLDAYEGETLGFLQPEAAAIRELGEAIVEHGGKGAAHVAPAVARLIQMLEGWDEVAQPLQLIRQAHGEGHAMSRDLARDVRSISVRMVNEHNLVDLGTEITAALSLHFAEISDMRDRFEEDASQLEDLRKALTERERSEEQLSYSAKIGLGQEVLSLNAREVSWGRQRFAVDEVQRIRWGGTSHSVNGIPTGTTYLIAFGSASSECQVSTRSKQVFTEVTSRLWRICGVPMLFRMLERLEAGEQFRIGEIVFTDDRVILSKPKFLAQAEAKAFRWGDVRAWSANGEFHVSADADPKFRAKASYQADANTHVLANVVSRALERDLTRLSDIIT